MGKDAGEGELFHGLHTHIRIHHSCWIHNGDKPIGTYTSPDLQLQLGPEERWVNFSTLHLVY